MKLLIKHGHVLDPSTGIDGIYDLLIENGMIKAVEKHIEGEADEVVDASDRYVMPGFIDLHVHLREPGFEYKETIKTGSMAAARGGFTSICAMPNTNPAADSVESIEFILKKAKKDALVNILPVGAITKGQSGLELTDISGMVKAGAIAISEDGKSVMDTSIYLESMKIAGKVGIPILAHCEDKSLVGIGVMNEGAKSRELGLPGISNAVEDVIAARDIILAKEAGAKLHLCHCSTKDSVTFVKMAKEDHLPVTAEVCPHHFTMSDDEIASDHGNYKMNPPLRSKEDVQALKEGLRDNILDVIATDHAPHGAEENNQSMAAAPFGIVGLETAFSLTMTELVKEGYLSPMQMVEKLSYNPAKVIGIDKGSLAVGKIADVVIGDPNARYKIDVNEFVSKGRNTPFDGKEVYGRIETTIVAGKVVYNITRSEEI
ncbi:dihydroorotase [Mobilisporobacter senegalensis]|uniref:Dihydroorotase n=1 Tax=Mobilisporobacter senegalensis TaxID=1329262 RepID=A0A3N1XNC8_9FIRM|nr:dihydroorotase [Mobilisporobacter senegalensis]ROR28200.1 dihydroorotase [Mobilisporobacter senegalensis]